MQYRSKIWGRHLAQRCERMRASEIRELLKLLDKPDIISFAGGIPDPQIFPYKLVSEAADRIWRDPKLAAQALQYAPSEGYAPLREWVAGYMRASGVSCDTDNILLTTGSQQALDLIAKLTMEPGRSVAVTAPTYLGALQAFHPYEPDFVTLDPEKPELAAAHIAYAVPDFANPSGQNLDLVSRQALAEQSAMHDCPLIEDAAYRDLRFEGEPLPSCQAIDVARTGSLEKSLVIYCGTFSKTLSPGMRVGWICAAKELVSKLVLAKQATDLHSPPLNQMIMHEIAQTGFERQIKRNSELYRIRRDAMQDALANAMPRSFGWQQPHGGMFFWLEGPPQLKSDEILPQAIARANVAFVPGGAFFAKNEGRHCLRLNFSVNSPQQIQKGIGRLAEVLKEECA